MSSVKEARDTQRQCRLSWPTGCITTFDSSEYRNREKRRELSNNLILTDNLEALILVIHGMSE